MKIFLTGASGFIGKKFAEFAANDGKFIYAQMRKKKNIFSLQRNIKCLIGDLDKDWSKELSKSSILVHFAAEGVNTNFSNGIDNDWCI